LSAAAKPPRDRLCRLDPITNHSSENTGQAVPHHWLPEGSFRLFLSHLSDHYDFAGQIRSWFKQYGISAFVAHQDIEPTHEWQATIESALNSMDALTALLHPNFHTSRWCDQEVGIGIGKQKLVVSVRLGADPHGFIGKYQAVPGANKTAFQIAEQLAGIFAVHPATAHAVARGAVHLLRTADSWEEAKRTMKFVETIASAAPETIALLESTPDANDQVSSAWGVPARITAVVQKWQQADA
jgi:hypothetical protein